MHISHFRKMNLNSFETEIEEKILQRGALYLRHGQIEYFEHVYKREFCSTVYGSERYSVYIKLNKKLDIIEHFCTCPYDWGNYCKHKVALLIHIKEGEIYEDEPLKSNGIKILSKDFSQFSKNELENLILKMAKMDWEFRDTLLSQLGYEIEDDHY